MHLSFLTRKSAVRSFLSLVISPGSAIAAIWSPDGDQIKITGRSIAIAFEGEGESEIAQACDAALENLGSAAIGIKEVLLGLPESWVEGQAIAPSKKGLLKSVTNQLELVSVGFVVTSEALIAHLISTGKAQQSIVVLCEESALDIHLIIGGSIQMQTKVGRTGQIVDDLTEAFSRMKGQQLPATLILASVSEDEGALKGYVSEISGGSWDASVFSHAPNVEMIPPSQVLDAVCLSGGLEVGKSLGLLTEGKPVPVKGAPASSQVSGFEPILDGDEQEEVSPEPHVHRMRAFPKPSLAIFTGKPLLPIGIGLVVLLLAAGGALAFSSRMIHTEVDITLRTQPVSIQDAFVVDAASDAATDVSKGVLKATLRTIETSVTGERATTGKKIIGDKAKGKVTIYNRTFAVKEFPAGTTLVLNSKIKYVTDSAISVASASAGSSYETIPGKNSVAITAADIGETANIGKDQELLVGTFDKSAYVARTETEVSGGNSRTIQAVSESDTTALIAQLSADVKTKAQSELTTQAGSGEKIIVSDSIEVTGKDFSVQVGQEAQTVGLTLSAKATAIVYTQDELKNLVSEKLLSAAPSASTLKPDSVALSITAQDVIDEDTVGIKAQVEAQAVPAFDKEQTKKLLAGKSLEDAQSFLKNQQSIGRYTIVFSPRILAAIFASVPTDTSRITIETHVE